MNVLIVDTSSWISFFQGRESPELDLALQEGRVYLSPIVLAELLSAQMNTKERKALESLLKDLPLCETTFEHWRSVGELRSTCSRKGLNLSTPDAHVAQCCLDLDGYLISEDGVFRKLAKLAPLRLG